MSNKISTIGKVWLIFLLVLASFGTVTNLLVAGKGIVYLIFFIACAGEVYGLIYLLKGKGILYLCIYGASYIVNAILNIIVDSNNQTIPYIVGFIFGIFINIGLTYLATKETFKK